MPTKRKPAAVAPAAAKVITTRQARMLNGVLEAFYADPKNQAAFIEWQKSRQPGNAP